MIPGPPGMPRARVLGTGHFLPPVVRTNREIERFVDTSDAWITERTGIRERHLATDGMTTSDMGAAASREALDMAGLKATDLDLIIVATVTPDMPMPSAAALVQHKIGAGPCPAIDVGAACAGFVFALTVAEQFIQTGKCKRVLVVGGDTLTKFLDWSDCKTCILFGDGAGAALVVPGDERSYVERSTYGSDGEGGKFLYRTGIRHEIDGKEDDTGLLRQSGSDVYKWAVRRISEAILEMLAGAGISAGDVDWFIPHSANLRIVEALCARTGLARERTLTSIETYGNTSTASIPLALMPALEDGRVKRGDRILMYGFGGGLVHAGTLLRW